MKVFVITRKNIIFYTLVLLAACSIFASRWDSSVYVFNQNTELNSLPIYCVDKGDEKICAISFDAACAACKSAIKIKGFKALQPLAIRLSCP